MIPSQEKLHFLDSKFCKTGRVHFEEYSSGMLVAKLEYEGSSACVSLFGATLISYIPSGHGETFFLSRVNDFQSGKPIRGGIPLCFPWFGADLGKANNPPHGFFRLLEWKVNDTCSDDNEVSITLSLSDSAESRNFWPYAFSAVCCISLGNDLTVKIKITNNDRDSINLTGAFHPYFRFDDIREMKIPSLQGQKYIENSASSRPDLKDKPLGSLALGEDVNRIYSYYGPVILYDYKDDRFIKITSRGMEVTGIWSPSKSKCLSTPDLGEDVFLKILCIEPGVMPPLTRKISPGGFFEAEIIINVGKIER